MSHSNSLDNLASYKYGWCNLLLAICDEEISKGKGDKWVGDTYKMLRFETLLDSQKLLLGLASADLKWSEHMFDELYKYLWPNGPEDKWPTWKTMRDAIKYTRDDDSTFKVARVACAATLVEGARLINEQMELVVIVKDYGEYKTVYSLRTRTAKCLHESLLIGLPIYSNMCKTRILRMQEALSALI